MKLRCPRCQKKLTVPDKYAGRGIRCPACNRGFTVPRPKAAIDGPGAQPDLDLEGLAKLEAGSSEMAGDELAEAQSTVDAHAVAAEAGKKVRTCPNCNKQTPADDPYVEMLCSHCWNPIPAMIRGSGEARAQRIAEARKAPGATGKGGFYAELATSVAYPIAALGSLATATAVAVLAGILPVAVITVGAGVMEQSAVGTAAGVQKADLSGAQMILMCVFAFEIVFFSAVAMHAFLDVVRTTSIGNDRPPNLNWNPAQWGKSFLAYIILAAYLGAASYFVAYLSIGDDPRTFLVKGDVMGMVKAGGSWFFVGMVIVSLGIPMNLVGISLGSIAQGLNPANVFVSISRTHAHYVFLVLILCVYGVMFGWAFVAILFDWFLPQVDLMIDSSKEGEIAQVALSMLAWGLVMGVFFYGTYILARLHGLFSRTFRKKLEFGTI